jgi:hypothetical protein
MKQVTPAEQPEPRRDQTKVPPAGVLTGSEAGKEGEGIDIEVGQTLMQRARGVPSMSCNDVLLK